MDTLYYSPSEGIGHEQVEWSDLVKGRDFYIGAEELSSTEGNNGQNE
jgi:hypothetical protein